MVEVMSASTYVCQVVQATGTSKYTTSCPQWFLIEQRKQILNLTTYSSRALKFIPGFLVGSVLLMFLAICMFLLCVFAFWILWCGVRCDFRINTMFGSSLPPVLWGSDHVLFPLFVCVYLPIVVSNTDCAVYFFVLSILCCQFLCIVHLWLALRCSLKFT
jgi:hypothetical protein